MSLSENNFPKIFAALDVSLDNNQVVENVIKKTGDKAGIKVHSLLDEVFVKNSFKSYLKGVSLWVDYKISDIPSTIEKRVIALSKVADYITISLENIGVEGVAAAVSARDKIQKEQGKNISLIGVTVLTSWSEEDYFLNKGVSKDLMVARLTNLAIDQGLDGVVCSAQEAPIVKYLAISKNSDIKVITPGIRPDWGMANKTQSRIETPQMAAEKGSDCLVVGTAIVKSDDPGAALGKIINEFEEGQNALNGLIKEIVEEDELSEKEAWLEYYHERLSPTQKIACLSVLELLQDLGAIYYLNEEKRKKGKWCRLTSGRVSPFYINIGGVVDRSPLVLARVGQEMANLVRKNNLKPQLTVGAAMGSVRLSAFAGSFLGLSSVYLEKGDSGLKASETELSFKRHNLEGVKKVVITEDLITKGTTVAQMIRKIKEQGVEIEAVVVAINRSGKKEIEGVKILALQEIEPFDLSEEEFVKQFPNAGISEKPKNEWGSLVKEQ